MIDNTAEGDGASTDRLSKHLARTLKADLISGRFAVGDRLPAERELSLRYRVSRPTVREAFIVLEAQGLIEVRIGSGAYVRRVPRAEDGSGFTVSAIELAEAQLLFESEAAALAATQITAEEIEAIASLAANLAQETMSLTARNRSAREFHMAIARAARNAAIHRTIEWLWDERAESHEAGQLFADNEQRTSISAVAEHGAIVAALRAGDPVAARDAMRKLLGRALEDLLIEAEQRAIREARRAAKATRDRYSRATA